MSRFRLAASFLLVGLVFGLYLPSLRNDFVIDDFTYIVENPAVTVGVPLTQYFTDRNTTAHRPDFRAQSYRPLRTVVFRLVTRAAGLSPWAFRLFNGVGFALSAILLFLLLVRLTGAEVPAFFATALWVAAPVHVEPVVYVSALGDHLSSVFALIAIGLALRTVGKSSERPRSSAIAYGLASTVCIFISMLAKEMAVTEVALLVLLFFLWRQEIDRGRAAWLVALHGAATILFLAIRTSVTSALGHHELTGDTLWEAVRGAPYYLIKYAQVSLQFLEHTPGYQVNPPSTLVAVLCLGAVLVAIAIAWRIGDRAFSLGLGWFILSLLPVLHFVPIAAFMADRFALWPSIGLALMLVALLARLPAKQRRLVQIGLVPVFALYCYGTLLEASTWKSDATLWRYAVEIQPGSAQAHANLGVVFLHEGQFEKAVVEFDRARALGRKDIYTDTRRALALQQLGRFAEAEAAVKESLALNPRDETLQAVLGALLVRRGEIAGAKEVLEHAHALAPQSPGTLSLEGEIDEASGRFAEATKLYQRILEHGENPRFRFLWLRAQCAQAVGTPLVGNPQVTPKTTVSAALDRLSPSDRQACEAWLKSAK